MGQKLLESAPEGEATLSTSTRSSYRKVIPPPRLVDQHAFRIELDTLFRKQLELLLDILPTRGLLPVTLEAANELNVIVSPALYFSDTNAAPLTPVLAIHR